MRKEIIGDAVLYCGDCLEIMPTLGKVDAVVTDPPYGTTACSWDSVIPFDKMWACIDIVSTDKSPIIMTSSQPFTTSLIHSNMDAFKYCLVWHKNRATNFPNAKRRPMTAHEDICVWINGPMWYNPQFTSGHEPTHSAKGASQGTIYHGDNIRDYEGGDTTRFPRTVIEFDCDRGYHPTQKPVSLMKYLIKTYSNQGEIVLDFTMGSGTTGVAAVQEGRKFIGIEIDEKYFDIACKRIEEAQKQLRLFA